MGCAGSRVPGELFPRRNLANVMGHSYLNCLSVIQYAMDMLEVKHIIVVGHSNCSGVATGLSDRLLGLADN